MVDIETGNIVDLLDSRESDKVKLWLSTFPNIELVSRDGSTSYRSAINESHPDAIQISDRFHLVKNLVKAISKYMKRIITGRIEIPLTSEAGKKRYNYLCDLSRREKIIEAKRLYEKNDESYNTIAHKMNLSPSTISKYIKMKNEDIPKKQVTVRGKEHSDAVEKIEKKRNKVLELWKQGKSKRDISKLTGYSVSSVYDYLNPDFNVVNGHYGKSQNGKLMPYRDKVITLRAEGLTYKEITAKIQEKGYTGTIDALRVFISKEKRIANDILSTKEPTELIDKRWINKLLYKPIEKIKGISKEQLEEVFKKYPKLKVLFEHLKDFRDLLLTDSKGTLDQWIEKATESGIEEIGSFINGISGDKEAVENAIRYHYSNGLAEGSVNKLKLIKRVMYGRNHFSLLRSKVLLLEALKK